MKITRDEWLLAGIFAFLGFIFTTKVWLLWLNLQSPYIGFLVYYVIVYLSLFILSKLGLVVWKLEIKKPLQVLGAVLILFSFFLIFNWENPYVQLISTGHLDGASQIFYGSEDGITWMFWTQTVGIDNIDIARILTFVLTPFVLCILAGMMLNKKPQISA